MNQIAANLKLSRTTVCYALGEQWRSVGIAEGTRDQIVATARQLGYRRNPIATSLKTQITKTIGVVVPNISGDVYEHLVHGLETALGEEYTLVLGTSGYDANKERKILQSFHDRLVDGLVIVHAGHSANIRWIRQLQEFEIPVVQADRSYRELRSDVVEADNDALGFVLTKQLRQQGDHAMYFVRSPVVNNGTLARAGGYARAMRAHGLKPRLWPAQPWNSAEDRVEFGCRHAREIFRADGHPLSIVAHDLTVAFGVLRAARQAGRADTVRIGTVANDSANPIYDFLPPNVTLAVWSVTDLGVRAGQLLLERMRQPAGQRSHFQTIRVPCRILQREAQR